MKIPGHFSATINNQATDRAYRIGQRRPVTIHIPMAVHPDEAIGPSSFDQRLDALMERKRSLSRGLLMPPESERDIEDLLADVLDGESSEALRAGGTSDAAPESSQENGSSSVALPNSSAIRTDQDGANYFTTDAIPTDAVIPSSTSRKNHSSNGASEEVASADFNTSTVRRPVLSTRSPLEAAEQRAAYVQRVAFEQYGTRDWTIFEQYVKGVTISLLEIQDPYCCADDQARGRLMSFISRFNKIASQISNVHIVTFDADSVQTREAESTNDQRRDLEERWNRMLASVQLRLAQKSRRAIGDLHDRFVKAHLDNGDTVIWDLGRGIDGIMSARWSCVVNAFYDGATPSLRLMH